MNIVFFFVIVLTFLSSLTECYRILLVWPIGGRSHYILGNALGKGLADAGHDVTMLSPFEDKVPPKNGSYRNIVLTGLLEVFEKNAKKMNLFQLSITNSLISPVFLQQMMGETLENMLSHPKLQKLLKSGEKFDVVIIENFCDDALRALAAHFDAHLVIFSPMFASSWVNDLTANPMPLSYIPEMATDFKPKMTFLERTHNLIIYLARRLITYGYVLPMQDAIRKKHFPNGPSVYDTLDNCSILLLNGHESLNQAVPLVPNMIPIGGYHVRPPKKLPQDLQQILDNAEEGVVYVSMGSNLQSKDMPQDKKDMLLGALGKLKQKVLFKWEEENMPNKPKNVEIRKWFPQNDLLAHPNIKLFVTHGGFGSTTETIVNGKPILAIPVFGDQISNALMAQENGYGKMIDFHGPNWSEARLYSLMRELLDDPRYSRTAKEKSRLFHDRTMKPMDAAVYWIEYVVRNNGAHHLRVAGTKIPWYQYYLLDVIAFLVVIIAAVVLILISVLKFVIKLFKKPIKVKKS